MFQMINLTSEINRVLFRHSDWYGKTANLAADWNDITSAIEIK